MRLPMTNHGAGPPNMDAPSMQGTTMASSRRTLKVSSCPAAALATLVKRHRWQIILAMVTCCIVSTIAYNEGSSATLGPELLGTVPPSSSSQPDFLLSQNATGGTLKLNHIMQRQIGLHAAGEKPHARSLWAHSRGTTDQLQPLEAKWYKLGPISTLLEFNLSGKGSLNYESGTDKKVKNDMASSTLRLDTSLGLGALAKITGFSSKLSLKGLQASSAKNLLVSLPHALKPVTEAVDVGTTDVYPTAAPASLSQGQLPCMDAGLPHLVPDVTSQPVKVSPDAASSTHLRSDSLLKQQAATESLQSEAWGLYKMTHLATIAPSTKLDQIGTQTRPTSILPELLGSAPWTHSASKEPFQLMALITSPAMPASPALSPSLHNLTMGLNFPVSRSSLEGTQSGPTKLITRKQLGYSSISSGVMAHDTVEPAWLSTVPRMQLSLMPTPPAGESYLDTSLSASLPSQVHVPSERSVTQFTEHLLPAGMPQTTSLLPAMVSRARPSSTKLTAAMSAPALLHMGDLLYITEHPLHGPVARPAVWSGPVTEATSAAAVTPAVSESAGWPTPPVPINTTAQMYPSSGVPAAFTRSVAVPSGVPLQSTVETDHSPSLSGHKGTGAHVASVPKLAATGLGQWLAPTTSLWGSSDASADMDMPSSLVLEVTSPEPSFLPGVPPTPVTSSDELTGAVVPESTRLTEAVTEALTPVAVATGGSAATYPLDHLRLDEERASASSTEKILPTAQLGEKQEEHATKRAWVASRTRTSAPWASDLGKAEEQEGSPGPAVTLSPTNLRVTPPSEESLRGAPGLGEMPVTSDIQTLTYSTLLTGWKPLVGFTPEDGAAYSPYHILPIDRHAASQPHTSACCPETPPSVSGATNATFHRQLAKKQMAAVVEMPTGSSELSLRVSGDAPATELSPHSSPAKLQAQPARKHFSLRRPGGRRMLSTPAASVSSHSPTPPPSVTSVHLFGPSRTSPQNETSPVRNDSSSIMVTVTHSTPLYLTTTREAAMADLMPMGMEHTPVASTTAVSSKSPIQGDHKGLDNSTKAVNFSRLAPAASPSRAMAPALGLPSTTTAVSKATLLSHRTATAPPPAQSTTAQLASKQVTWSPGPQAPILQLPTEAKPTVVTPLNATMKTTVLLTSARNPVTPALQLPTVKPTRLMPPNKTTMPTLQSLHTSGLSTHLLLTSQRSSTAKMGLHVLTALTATRKNLTTKQVTTIKISHMSKQTLPKSKVPTLSFPSEGDNGSASGPTSPALQLPVHSLPLRFRLHGIAYTQLLKNKSSESYKKLEKEVTLTLNKMFSRYENFLRANILQFLNGSLIVESEVLFQGDIPAPSHSDLIRTLLSEVGKKMDTFFDWRVDVQSIWSNGFSLENLEPEKLLVSLTALRLGWIVALDGMARKGPLEKLTHVVVESLGALYKVKNFFISRLRDIKGDLEISGEAYIDTPTHADTNQVLQVLRSLINYSVDLTTLSVDDARLNLQVFPITFLVHNWMAGEKLLDHSSVEHQNLTRDLADVLMHALRKYQGLLQVVIRDILSGSLICHGDLVFQPPAPASTDVLQTLFHSIGPGDELAGSGFQVDPYSFTVADDRLEPPFMYPTFPGYGVAITVLCGLVVVAIPLVALLYLNSGVFGWHGKAVIQGGRDPEAGMQTFELDNQGFRSTIEEDDRRGSYTTTKLSSRE